MCFSLANFGKAARKFLSEFFQRNFLANSSAFFSRVRGNKNLPPKSMPKIVGIPLQFQIFEDQDVSGRGPKLLRSCLDVEISLWSSPDPNL